MPTDAVSLRERAVRASARGRPATAVRLLRQALASVDDHPDAADLRARLLVSLAHAEAETSGVSGGLRRLDEVDLRADGVRAATTGLWHGQRGLLLVRAGRHREASGHLDAAEPLLADEPVELTRVLMNRGVLAMSRRRLAEAATDFERCLDVARAADLTVQAGKAVGNLGYLAYLRGDLPRALRLMEECRSALAPHSAALAGIATADLAQALVAAGLLDDAAARLAEAARLLGRALPQDRAEVELRLADVYRLQGRDGEALRWARRAHDRFTRRGATGWSLAAELLVERLRAARDPGGTADRCRSLAEELAAAGLVEDAAVARLVRLSALVPAGRADVAALEVRTSAPPVPAGIGTRMLAHEARALVAEAHGDRRGAQRVRRRGLRELAAHQSRLGSVDLLTGASSIGARLAADGLAEAVREGRAGSVLRWSELVRATASRIPPVRPPADPELAERLARLRFVAAEERAARLAGRGPDPDLRAEADALRRAVRERAWHAPGALHVDSPASMAELRTALGDDGTLVALMVAGDAVHALAVTGSRARLEPVAPVRTVREHVLRVRADLDALAMPALTAALQAAVGASLQRGLEALESLATSALGDIDPGGPVVVVPTGMTALVPWPLLAPLRGRPMCVAPSATWWLRARERSSAGDGRSVLVAGPDVRRAVAEVAACAATAADPVVLTGAEATVAAALSAADGSSVLHVAAHGQHEADNPLFSRLLLADGPLFGHDLDVVRTLPDHVVLSACETGLSSVRPGDEALGMTAALLHGGTRSTVASVARVGDELAEQVAVAHHRGLRAGSDPASALAAALESADGVAPTVCFGAGW